LSSSKLFKMINLLRTLWEHDTGYIHIIHIWFCKKC